MFSKGGKMSNKFTRELLAASEKRLNELREIRRDLHRHPELGFQEFRTTQKIREYLHRIPGIKFRNLECKTGVIADLPGDSGKTIALRADIDALPIREENTHSYASEVPGLMHACGHDGHVAILLGAAFLLGKLPSRPWTIRFIFQPAEEIVPSGAPVFVREGAIDKVEAIFGFHLNATSDFGKVGWYDGAVMAGGLSFQIEVHGKGGHPAYPEKCVNPIYTACDIVAALPRLRDAFHAIVPCNVTPVKLVADEAGKIPEIAVIKGQFKFLDRKTDQIFRRELTALAEGSAVRNHSTCNLKMTSTYPVSWNAAELGQRTVIPSARELGLELTQIVPSMGSDDFAWYAEKIPAYYMTFGLRKGINFPIAHTSEFDFDEAILPLGAAQMAACAINWSP